MIDSTMIWAHHQGRPYTVDGAKGGLKNRVLGAQTTKVHVRVTGEGLPIATEITGGEVSDYKGYDIVMDAEGPEQKVLIADKGYDADPAFVTTWKPKAASPSFRCAAGARRKSLSTGATD